jgi:hypothetical protein
MPVRNLILKKETQVMRTRTQLSSLAIAAIAILAATTTSFAQTNDRNAAAMSAVTVSANQLTAMNVKPRANTMAESFAAKSLSEARLVVKPLTLSAATFAAGSRFATINANQFVSQQVSTEMKMSAGVTSNTANEFSETKTRNVEFIPCRIPKFPYREN